jgi:uncharacterized protein YndB with AHSA1/START domain
MEIAPWVPDGPLNKELTVPDATEIRIEASIKASRHGIYSAWTRAESLRRWCAPAGVDVAEVTISPVVGGHLRLTMRQGDATETAVGVFKNLVPGETLHFTWGQEGNAAVPITDIKIYLEDTSDGGTKVVLVQSGIPANAPREIYVRAWTGILDKLRESIHDVKG